MNRRERRTQKVFLRQRTLSSESKVGFFMIFTDSPKGGFFSESEMCFLDLQISKKNIPTNYPELEI